MLSAARLVVVLASLVFQLSQGDCEQPKNPSNACLSASVSWNLHLLPATMISDQDSFSPAAAYIKPKWLVNIFMLQNDFLSTQLNLHTGIVVLLSFAQLRNNM